MTIQNSQIPAVPTPSKVMLGEGVYVYNYGETDEAIIGATRGGGSFKNEVTIREIPFDGAMGPVKGMRRITRAVATLTANMMELNAANLKKYFAGLTVTDNTTYDTVTGTDVAAADYHKNIAFVGLTYDAKQVIIIVKNALGDGNLELAWRDNDEVVPATQWTAHYDTTTPTTQPWEIRWPK